MIGLFCFVLAVLASPFKSKLRLEAENAVLRHQLIVLRRRLHGRVRLTNNDRWFFIQLYRWFPSILKVLTVIRPETLVRWHRTGFRCYWRWKSLPLGGRPPIDMDLRMLIRQMSVENPLWGAPRIHGELLKLGFEVAQSSIAKYMAKPRGPRSQGWRTFLRNHAPDIAAMDLFVVPTIAFDLLYAFVIVRLDRRDLVWINVTANPTAEWVARQITEAFPWDEAPSYLIRDRDRIYGSVVTRRLRAMGIRDKPTAPASPWQNGFVERLIGSILRRILQLRQNASILEQGCAGFSPGSTNRCNQFTRHPGRTSSSLCSDLTFSVHTGPLSIMVTASSITRCGKPHVLFRSPSTSLSSAINACIRRGRPGDASRPCRPIAEHFTLAGKKVLTGHAKWIGRDDRRGVKLQHGSVL
jgi:hypothetical protein